LPRFLKYFLVLSFSYGLFLFSFDYFLADLMSATKYVVQACAYGLIMSLLFSRKTS